MSQGWSQYQVLMFRLEMSWGWSQFQVLLFKLVMSWGWSWYQVLLFKLVMSCVSGACGGPQHTSDPVQTGKQRHPGVHRWCHRWRQGVLGVSSKRGEVCMCSSWFPLVKCEPAFLRSCVQGWSCSVLIKPSTVFCFFDVCSFPFQSLPWLSKWMRSTSLVAS